jgi:hypothetical protein
MKQEVAHVDERVALALAMQSEGQSPDIPNRHFLDIADLDRVGQTRWSVWRHDGRRPSGALIAIATKTGNNSPRGRENPRNVGGER